MVDVHQSMIGCSSSEVAVSDKPTILGEVHSLYWSSWPYVMTALGIVIALAYAIKGGLLLTLGGFCTTAWGLSDLAARRGRGSKVSRAVGIVCGSLGLLIFLAHLLAPWRTILAR